MAHTLPSADGLKNVWGSNPPTYPTHPGPTGWPLCSVIQIRTRGESTLLDWGADSGLRGEQKEFAQLWLPQANDCGRPHQLAAVGAKLKGFGHGVSVHTPHM